MKICAAGALESGFVPALRDDVFEPTQAQAPSRFTRPQAPDWPARSPGSPLHAPMFLSVLMIVPSSCRGGVCILVVIFSILFPAACRIPRFVSIGWKTIWPRHSPDRALDEHLSSS